MDGFKAYRYYTAIRLHFTSAKFDVFQNKGRVKCSLEKFQQRNDHYIFEKLGRKFNDKEFIQYCASNFMYGNSDVIYNNEESDTNYLEYIKRKQSITKVFSDDLNTLLLNTWQVQQNPFKFSGSNLPTIIQLYISKRITIETIRILDDIEPFIDNLKENSNVKLLWSDEILRIEKSKGFVKYNKEKILPIYNDTFKEELTGL